VNISIDKVSGYHVTKTWWGIKLAKKGVHWQTLATSKSREKSNEPTRDILPEDCLPRKGANWKRKYPYS
jgi:hypothetical protein